MRLSVVVTIVDAGDALRRTLDALAGQREPPALEVIVPWDATVPGIDELARRFPGFTFLELGVLPTERPVMSQAGQHELFDRRRSAGLARASGDLVAILEDRGVPRPDWAAQLVAVHKRLPHAAIGGGIGNAIDAVLQWAVFFCDFGRYQPPFEPGPRAYLSDINIAYKRRLLDETRAIWSDRYHETSVHWALARRGEILYLTPEFVVDQVREHLTFAAMLGERYAWGRLFAHTRAREVGRARSVVWAAATPVLPALLLLRQLRMQVGKQTLTSWLRALPVIVVLLVCWSAGELVGYVTRRP